MTNAGFPLCINKSNMSKTECNHKIQIKLKEAIESATEPGRYLTYVSVPCGSCANCITRRKLEWGFRMEWEMKRSKTAYFVTLTYNNENVPYTKYGRKTLLPHKDVTELIKKRGMKKRVRVLRDDLKAFIKRLRTYTDRCDIEPEHFFNNLTKEDKIKYYAAGEYGENSTKRPHYHLIIFNATEKGIYQSWNMGQVHCVKANRYTISYVMKYLDKRLGKEQDWRVTPEYNTMSEGIGESYISKWRIWHRSNLDLLFVTNELGIKIPMPKYYRDRIYTETDRRYQLFIVSDSIEEAKQKLIDDVGQGMYNDIQRRKNEYTEVKFNKSIKKRIID